MGCGVIFIFAAIFYQAQSQLCVAPGIGPQVIANAPIVTAPQTITTPIIATTIVDNSVSTALANALQLLIVSDILESKLGASITNWLNLNPIETPCYPRIEVIQPIAECITPIPPCVTPVDIITPYPRPTIEPYLPGCNAEIIYPYVPNTNCYNTPEIFSPNFNPYGCVEIISTNPCAPMCTTELVTIPSYNNVYELITPIPSNPCGEIIEYNPCGVTEVISPYGQYFRTIPEILPPSPCNCGCYSSQPELITPYGGITEIITPFNSVCGVPEIVQPCSSYYGSIPEVISPIYKPGYIGIPELLPTNPFGPCREILPTCSNFPEVIIPPCNGGCSGCDFCGPPAFSPCVKEIVNPPCSFSPTTNVVFPPSIPFQIPCNCGCSPCSGPCMNVESFGPNFCY